MDGEQGGAAPERPAWILAFLVGLANAPVGALLVLALEREPPRVGLLGGAVAAALAAVLALRLAGPRMGLATAAGLIAWPALAAVLLDVGPPPAFLLVAIAAVAAGLALRPSHGEWLRVATACLLLGSLATGLAAWVWARASSGEVTISEGMRLAALDRDAIVPLRAETGCSARTGSWKLLVPAGANPGFGPDGVLWFDAPGPDGRRQVHRLGEAGPECWTCEEAGQNRRPSPGRGGVFFDTDRFATSLHPTDTELMWAPYSMRPGATHQRATRPGDTRRRAAGARRLSFRPGPDQAPRTDPWGVGVLWTRGFAGSFEVVHAAFERGHGGLRLGDPRALRRGGTRYLSASAWAPDARALVIASGNGAASASALRLDPGAPGAVAEELGATLSVSFSADGRVMARVSGQPLSAWRASLGFLRARLPGLPSSAPGEAVWLGPSEGPSQRLELGEVAAFGAPTGVALAADARSLALSQRSQDGAERIVEVALACAP